MRSIISRLTLAAAALLMGAMPMGIAARAEDAQVFTITIKDHKFDPAELHVPAGKPVTLLVKNADPTAEEFESSALKVEKLIPGGQQGTIRLRLLPAGNYSIVGEFHEDTAKGRVIAE
jgi:plastocyanin